MACIKPCEMKTCIPSLSEDFLEELERDAKEYALAKGLCMRARNVTNADCVELVKFTLFPSPFPSKWLSLARNIQTSINLMVHRVAHDKEFLFHSLKDIIKVDDFTRQLYNIHVQVNADSKAQATNLGIFRSDYMVNSNPECIRQIEVNTIAASFGGLSSIIDEIHNYVLHKVNPERPVDFSAVDVRKKLAETLIKAWKFYGNPKAIILFVVEENIINICDQRTLEAEIFANNRQVIVRRKRFKDLVRSISLNENNTLIVDGSEVAVLYYRTGYVPQDYDCPEAWNIRLKLEISRAIKCPSVRYQLAGLKKIQQVLTNKEILKKFLPSSSQCDDVFSTFGNIYPLAKSENGKYAIEKALKDPQNYVLKPQREGGGNNLFGKEMVEYLIQKRDSPELDMFILMKLVKPDSVYNYSISSGKSLSQKGYAKTEMVSELGIYGAILANEKEVFFNEQIGTLLRSKDVNINESGIASGFGHLDTPQEY